MTFGEGLNKEVVLRLLKARTRTIVTRRILHTNRCDYATLTVPTQ